MTHHTDHADLPEDLRDIARGLDALAKADATEAPAGMESRIIAATLDRVADRPVVAGRIGIARAWGWSSTPYRIAAGLLFCLSCVAAWIATRPAPAQASVASSLESDLEVWLAASEHLDSALGGLESLTSNVATLNESIAQGWGGGDEVAEDWGSL